MLDLKTIHSYWKNPNDGRNSYRFYQTGYERSLFAASIFLKYIPFDANIVELGCNIGRNLRVLEAIGYTKLTGVDINADAVKNKITTAPIVLGSIEDYLCINTHSVVFTMATFEHIHKDSEWIFDIIRNTASIIVTIEDEHQRSHRHFPRNYKKVFGGRQVFHKNCRYIVGLNRKFHARVIYT